MFCINMLPLGEIIRKYDLGFHCCADDKQIYISTLPDPNLAITALTSCLEEIKVWMHDNYLKLNKSKTELLLVGMPAALHKCKTLRLFTDSDFLSPASQVQNLGVIFDS